MGYRGQIDLRVDTEGKRYVRPYLGLNKVTGKPMRPYMSFPDDLTDEECLERAREWLEEILPYAEKKVQPRLDELLAHYIDAHELNKAFTANTVATYRTLAAYVGKLGKLPVRDVSTGDIDALYTHLLAEGGADGVGLSTATVGLLHSFLRKAWSYFIKIGAADTSPVIAADKPGQASPDAVALDQDEYEALSAVIEDGLKPGTRTLRRIASIAALLSLNTGMRCGECCALLRKDAHLDTRTVLVCATVSEGSGLPVRQNKTKTKRSRTVAVPAEMCDIIQAHLAWQDTHLARTGARTPLVSASGGIMRPSTISREFSAMVREAGLPKNVTFHTLRHTHASWLVAHGVDAKTVSERLGHADVATTLRIYSHVMPGRDQAAADLFSRLKQRTKED